MKRKINKKLLITALAVSLTVLSLPTITISVGLNLPAQFDESFYGELVPMVNKLRNCTSKKIVIIGNSNVAFGVDSALMRSSLRSSLPGYEVCNFGLYGAIGTKAMLDLARSYIYKDDIVLFAPEWNDQIMSLYLNPNEIWRSLEGDYSLFFNFNNSDKTMLLMNLNHHLSEKYEYYISNEKAIPEDIYVKSSFDSNCDMKNYPREYNIMYDLYDPNYMIDWSLDLYGDAFCSYVNEFYHDINAKGASMYFTFAPMNMGAIVDKSEEAIKHFYDYTANSFEFKVISNPKTYMMDEAWFYDSNFHLNKYGMIIRTYNLINDLKNELGISVPTNIELPEIPAIPPQVFEDGNDEHQAYFTYQSEGDHYVIDGMTALGVGKKDIIIPSTYNDLPVTSFKANVFAGNTALSSVTIQPSIRVLEDRSFYGCSALRSVYVEANKPNNTSIGFNLLDGTNDVSIYVQSASVTSYRHDYFWGHYGSQIKSYEKK
ncbi:MAG: leucine-rich repeat protein [Bacilli bacterium]